MKRPHMRSIVYASAAGAFICCGIFVQAAGPIGFVSRIWRERPVILRTKESRLNPMNWFGRKQADASDESVAADGRRTLERSELTIDPFLTESPAAASPASEAAKSPASNIVRAPLVVEQRTTLSATGLGAVDVPTTDRKRPNNPGTNASRQEESSLPAARRSPAQVTRVEATQRAPRLPTPGGFGAFESPAAGQTGRRAPTAAAPTTPQSRRRPAQANRIVKPSTGGNRFVGGFDAEFAKLVQSVIAETENGTVQAPVPRLPGTGGPSTRANDQTPSLAGGTSERRTTGSASETSSSGTPLLPSQSNISAIGSTPELSGVASEFSMASERAEFARYASQLTGESVSDVIEASRQRIANTPLAARQNMSREQLTAAQGRQGQPGQPGSQVQPIESTRPRVPSDSRLNMRHETTMQITPGRAGSGFIIESPGSRPVRPRVTSNGAPLRSVPDHLEFERLSYQTDETMHAGPLADAAANGPLLMLPNEHHPNGQHFLEPAESDSNGNAAALPRTADSSTNWWPSEADTAADEPGSGAGWVVAVMCLILTVIAGGYAARRKLQIDSFDITRIRQRFEKD